LYVSKNNYNVLSLDYSGLNEYVNPQAEHCKKLFSE